MNRSQRIQTILADYVAARSRGENTPPGRLFAEHPDLMPELETALRAALASAQPTEETLALPIRPTRPSPKAAPEPPSPKPQRPLEDKTLTIGGPAPKPDLAGPPPPRRSDSAPPGPALDDAIEGYELLRELSRGGQGVVFLALQVSTRRHVAVKLLLEAGAISPATRRRFEREIEMVAQLNHPNIITIFDAGITKRGRQYYVMDYIEGLPLDRHIRDNNLSLEKTLDLMRRTVEAVQYAHQRGMIHRDLKPSNILVDKNGDPKILDFGLAKRQDQRAEAEVSIAEQVVGTLPYMSPEQAHGRYEQIDTRTDVYALGVILYRLLTGEYPYDVQGNLLEAVEKISRSDPTPLTQQWSRSGLGIKHRELKSFSRGECPIDEEVQTVVLKCLAKDPERRYQSAGELARDIERYLRGEPILARADSMWYVLRKRMRLYRAAVIVFAGFMLLASISAVALFGMYKKQTALVKEVSEEKGKTEKARKSEEEQRIKAQEAAKLAIRQTYRASLAAADASLKIGDISTAAYHLNAAPMEHRGWEWRYLRSGLDASLMTLPSDGGPVQSIAFAARGSRLFSFERNGAWSALKLPGGVGETPSSAGDRLQRGKTGADAHTFLRAAFAHDPDAAWILDNAGKLLYLPLDSGAIAQLVDVGDRTLNLLAIDPARGQLAVSDITGAIGLIRLADREALPPFKAHDGLVTAMAFPSDENRLLSGGADGAVHVWDVENNKKVNTFSSGGDRITSLAYSEFGRRVAASSANAIRVWSLADSSRSLTFQLRESAIRAIAFSPDGLFLVCGLEDGSLRCQDASTGAPVALLRGHTAAITDIAVDPEFRFLATASLDGTTRLWDVAALERGCRQIAPGEQMTDGWIAPDGSRVACATPDHQLIIADLNERSALTKIATGHLSPITAVVWHASDDRIATGGLDKTVRIRSLSASDQAITHTLGGEVTALAAAESALFVGLSDGSILRCAWEGENDPIAVHRLNDAISALVPIGNADKLCAATMDGHVALLTLPDDATEGKALFDTKAHEGAVVGLAWDEASGRFFTLGEDNTLAVVGTGGEVAGRCSVGQGAARCLLFAPDDRRLFVGTSIGLIHIWDSRTLEPLLSASQSQAAVSCMSMAGNATLLALYAEGSLARLAAPLTQRPEHSGD